jgi:hypothetical protein
MENTMSIANEKQVGKVRVTSGQLLFVDPCHIDDKWKYNEGPSRTELWGDEDGLVLRELRKCYPDMPIERRPPGVPAIPLGPDLSASKVNRRITQAAKKVGASRIVAAPQVEDSINECINKVCTTRKGGEVLNKHAVVAQVGAGNGLYPAFVTYSDVGPIAALTIRLSKANNAKPANPTKKKVRRIGRVPVDSGQIMVIDPANIPGDLEMQWIRSDCSGQSMSPDGAGPILKTLAIATSTAFGDGYYPVYATYDVTDQIVELSIRFMPGDWLRNA